MHPVHSLASPKLANRNRNGNANANSNGNGNGSTGADGQGPDRDWARLAAKLLDELNDRECFGRELRVRGPTATAVLESVVHALTAIFDGVDVTGISLRPVLEQVAGIGLTAELSGTGMRLQLDVYADPERPPTATAGPPGAPGRRQVSILVAGVRQAFIQGLGLALDANGDLQVVGVATDQAEAGHLADELQPDVLLLDVHPPIAGATDMVAAYRATSPAVKLLALAADGEPATKERFMAAGADEIITRNASVVEVAQAARGLAAGVSAGERLAPQLSSSGDAGIDLMVSTLSAREREVLALLVDGRSNPHIAQELSLSVNTVRKHVERILIKLDVHSKLEAAVFATTHGLAMDPSLR